MAKPFPRTASRMWPTSFPTPRKSRALNDLAVESRGIKGTSLESRVPREHQNRVKWVGRAHSARSGELKNGCTRFTNVDHRVLRHRPAHEGAQAIPVRADARAAAALQPRLRGLRKNSIPGARAEKAAHA